MSKQPRYVELDRRFLELDEGESSEDAAFDSYTSLRWGGESGLGWKELLERRLVVVLGEPGSGKTLEFRKRAESLSNEGRVAFFIRLDQLALQPLGEVLRTEEHQRFQDWGESREPGWFFLDSVDEAKLQGSRDFRVALDRFRDALGADGLERARIFISCRVSDWHPQTDKHEVVKRFPEPSSPRLPDGSSQDGDHGDKSRQILVVQLASLDRQRVHQFAGEAAEVNPDTFVQALDEQHAWDFAGRPKDVIDLMSMWGREGRFGFLTEMVENDVERKLRERVERERHDPLSEGQAREGAETLAAAAVFCRQLTFRVPDDENSSQDGVLDASLCLPDGWRPEQCRALLTRPLFDGASYGQIRFHHRGSVEYLAAQWIEKRMQDGCPMNRLRSLLFGETAGRLVIRRTLIPVTAWLCGGSNLWNEGVRDWVLTAAPWILLQHGDPAGLPVEYKRKALHALVKAWEGRKQVWVTSDAVSLSRFADPALEDDIAALIKDRTLSDDLRDQLLQLAEFGRLDRCLEQAIGIVASPDESDRLRAYAASAVRTTEKIEHRVQLGKASERLPTIPHDLCAMLCEALYPQVIDAAGLATLLRKVETTSKSGSYLPWHLEKHLEAVLSSEDGGPVLSQLVKLMQTPPFYESDSEAVPISVRFGWLLRAIPAVLVVLLRKKSLAPEEIDDASTALYLLPYAKATGVFSRDLPEELASATLRHPAVRRRYIQLLVEEQQEKNSEVPLGGLFSALGHGAIPVPVLDDVDWLIEDIEARERQEYCELALRLTLDLWQDSGRQPTLRRRIRRAIKGDPSLEEVFKKRVTGMRFLRFRRLWYRHVHYKIGQRFWWEQRLLAVKAYWWRVRDQCRLLRHMRRLASGQKLEWLALLVEEARGKDNHDKWTPTDWSEVSKKRGRLVARAARKGCKRLWRGFVPELYHEKPDHSKTNKRVIIGLAGIQAALEDGELSWTTISQEDARLSARYAVNELSGFTRWFTDLAQCQPEAVREVLSECVRGEWELNSDNAHVYKTIPDLVSRGEGLAHLVHGTVLAKLQSGDPAKLHVLRQALTLLLDSESPPRSELAKIAADRMRECNASDSNFLLWMAVWLQLDAEPALRRLSEALSDVPDSASRMVSLCGILSSEDRGPTLLLSEADYMTPSHLGTFIPLLFGHVRPCDDIDRSGQGHYTPTDRDDAQRFRNSLLTRLAESESPEADVVLRDLGKAPALADFKDWLLHLMEQRAERRADHPPWKPNDVRDFAKDYGTDPKTGRDLFTLACNRMEDIKHAVEDSDISLRDELREGDDESKLRQWLTRKLVDGSRNRYTVPQEGEIDQRRRPDLRIEHPGLPPVPIELKWSGSWSLKDLLEGLEGQLVGKYLRDHKVRYGVYLLGHDKRKASWRHGADNRTIDFSELLQILEGRARELVDGNPGVADIAVIGIDFTVPSQSKKE